MDSPILRKVEILSEKLSRRGFFAGAGSIATTAGVIGATSGAVAGSAASALVNAENSKTAVLKAAVPAIGRHQAGIETEIQSFTNFIAFDTLPATDGAAMVRWLSLLTDDITRLTRGEPVLADPQPELAIGPARLTVTLGFGTSLFEKLQLPKALWPNSFRPLPSFKIDQLKPEYSAGDLLLHVAADDPIVLSYATRALIRDSMSFSTVRWVQQGFTNAQGTVPPGMTHRNLMGQVDGTQNPSPGTAEFENLVWIKEGPSWILEGTLLVFRRIEMNLDTWDSLGKTQKEQTIGRRLVDGAPLTGSKESDPPDFAAVDETGLKIIPDFAHIRRAAPVAPSERFLRRPFSYDQGSNATGSVSAGLLWTAYQADIDRQFLPVQRRLEQLDLLNQWTTPIGSAVFAIPRGFQDGEYLAQDLFG